MGRLLGIDYGEARVGLAISDPLHTVATPLETIHVTGRKALLATLEDRCRERGVDAVVVGLPLHLDGGAGELAKAARTFAAQLQARLPKVEVIEWDERLTSRQAELAMRETGTKRRRRKDMIDQIAAQIMLQSFLDAQTAEWD